MLVELEVVEESVKFIEGGEIEIPIRRCRRVGDMWRPGTQRPPTKEDIAAEQAATKAKIAAERAAAEEAERAEQEENCPPMFDDNGDPVEPDAAGPALSVVSDVGPEFSDGAP